MCGQNFARTWTAPATAPRNRTGKPHLPKYRPTSFFKYLLWLIPESLTSYPGCENMIPPSDLLFYFFRVGKFSTNFQKIFRGLRPLQFSKVFGNFTFFILKISKFFSGAPRPNPRFFQLVRTWPSRFPSWIWYSHEISKNCYKIQGFQHENIEIFPGAPPSDTQCFSQKSFRVGKKK